MECKSFRRRNMAPGACSVLSPEVRGCTETDQVVRGELVTLGSPWIPVIPFETAEHLCSQEQTPPFRHYAILSDPNARNRQDDKQRIGEGWLTNATLMLSVVQLRAWLCVR